jgi:hypothetical protein
MSAGRTAVGGDDRELLAVLVALEPLDDRKWDYLDVERRTFDSDAMLDQPWSSGERVLVEVAASLWNAGRVDLGYVASGMGGRHFQAVIDALAVRSGQSFASTPDTAIERVLGETAQERPSAASRRREALAIEDRLVTRRTGPGLER